jgi:hypothetical protein
MDPVECPLDISFLVQSNTLLIALQALTQSRRTILPPNDKIQRVRAYILAAEAVRQSGFQEHLYNALNGNTRICSLTVAFGEFELSPILHRRAGWRCNEASA